MWFNNYVGVLFVMGFFGVKGIVLVVVCNVVIVLIVNLLCVLVFVCYGLVWFIGCVLVC